MDSKLSINFFNKINKLDDRNYILSIIRFHAAPILSGKKPSCLISFTDNNRSLYRLWDTYKEEICTLVNLSYFEICRYSKRELVLLYDTHALEITIKKPGNTKFLQGFGYNGAEKILECLEVLKGRFSEGFPHEIGIFLGIPCEDVRGFIQNSGNNYIMNGYWKVYSKPSRAGQLFNEYDAARIDVMKSIIDELQ